MVSRRPSSARRAARSAFTAEGNLTYDIAARPAFVFRFPATGEEED